MMSASRVLPTRLPLLSYLLSMPYCFSFLYSVRSEKPSSFAAFFRFPPLRSNAFSMSCLPISLMLRLSVSDISSASAYSTLLPILPADTDAVLPLFTSTAGRLFLISTAFDVISVASSMRCRSPFISLFRSRTFPLSSLSILYSVSRSFS